MSAVCGEQQQNEIATIKERTFMLKLSDADVRKIYEKADGIGAAAKLYRGFGMRHL